VRGTINRQDAKDAKTKNGITVVDAKGRRDEERGEKGEGRRDGSFAEAQDDTAKRKRIRVILSNAKNPFSAIGCHTLGV
jgi:hypothetical protein